MEDIMKTITIAAVAILIFTARAGAFSWDDLVSKPVKSFKNLFSTQAAEPAAPVKTEETMPLPLNLPPAQAKTYLETIKPVLIDVRKPEEYAAGHLENSLSIDYYATDFKDKLGKLDKTAKYLIYCRSGKRSAASLKIMQELGFTDIHDIAGGINAWIEAGLPIVK